MARVHLLRYLLTVFRHLPGSWKQRIRIVRKMGRSIRDYVSEGADVTYGQLVKRFGEPRQVAFIYVNEMETDELIMRLKINSRIVSAVLVAVTLLIIMRFCFNLVSLNAFERDVNGYAVVEIIEVERKVIDEGE